ncbi:hypothetical protein [Bradyrhizobium sp. AZCC 1693]|uniref:hypothetical protein n=1 Tax=Bradyrhizobium sp. AZCC 1693 TaxID=3117029 RepID=UPI002FF0D957
MTDQEKKLRTVHIELARDRSPPWSPMLDGHAYRSNFQSELHQEAILLLRANGIESESSSRSDDVKIAFGRYTLSIYGDGANVHGIPNLDTYFKVENFAHLDHLKKSVLRLLTTLLNMDQIGRAPFEDAIKAAVQKRIGSPIKIYNSKATPNGVFLFERLQENDAQSTNWQEVAVELARVTDVAVLSIFHSWAVENSSIDLTVVAFYFPGLTEGYWNDSRNLIEPVDPSGNIFEEK